MADGCKIYVQNVLFGVDLDFLFVCLLFLETNLHWGGEDDKREHMNLKCTDKQWD